MLLDEGWSPEQAQAVLDKLMLREGIPDWKPQHLKRFEEWCAAEGKEKNAVDSQLEFVAYDLCNEHQTIGMSLKLARTLEEAKEAVVPYVRMLSEESDWYRQPSRRRV
jgi:hypothetical protein